MRETLLNSKLIEIRNRQVDVFRNGGGTRPDVLEIDYFGKTVVLKDHNGSDRWFSRLIGPLLTYREVKALRQLADVKGIPNLIERVDRRAFLMEDLDAVQLKNAGFNVDWPIFFERLTQLVELMHRQGVAHCDLRSPGNTLVDLDGRPYLVDFVACVFCGRRWNLISHWLFAKFREADRGAILKLKQGFAPELLDDQELSSMQHRSLLDCIARTIGSNIRKISKNLFANSK